MKTKLFFKISAAAYLMAGAGVAFAQSAEAPKDCSTYPYQVDDSKLTFEDGGKFRIVATAGASITFDDVRGLTAARRKAELTARRMLAEYINNKLSSEDSINEEMNTSETLKKLADGSSEIEASRDTIEKQISNIASRADVVLRGAMPLGSCYTKGSEVRVTIGIKSETVANATQLGETMGVNAAQAYGNTPAPAAVPPKDVAAAPSTVVKPAAPKDGETQSYSGGSLIKDF